MVKLPGYDYKLSLWKGLRRALQFGVPYAFALALEFHPEWSALTLRALSEVVLNWLKHKDQ